MVLGRSAVALAIALGATLSACVFWDMGSWDDGLAAATDTDGGVTEAGEDVVPAIDAGAVLAKDTFTRRVTNGLGIADIGGLWTVSGEASSFAVDGERATFTLTSAGQGISAALADLVTDDVDLVGTLTVEGFPIGGSGLYLGLCPRRTKDRNYCARIVVRADGHVDATLSLGDDREPLAPQKTVFSVAKGEGIHVRTQATGVAPTHARLKIWKGDDPEPEGWYIDATDDFAGLQQKGAVGVQGYVGNGTTAIPLVFTLDGLLVREASKL